jgi:hypothetical protein
MKETYCFHLQPSRWRQYVFPKLWFIPACPHYVPTQKTNTDKSLTNHITLSKEYEEERQSCFIYVPSSSPAAHDGYCNQFHIVTVLDCSTQILFKMDLYYSQIFQQLQLSSVHNSLSMLKQYLSVQSSFSTFTIQVIFFTSRQHSTSV